MNQNPTTTPDSKKRKKHATRRKRGIVLVDCDMRGGSPQLQLSGGKARFACGGPSVESGLGCGALSEWHVVRSPAAPAIELAEDLEASGWTHDGGEWSSVQRGVSVLCPACSAKARTTVPTATDPAGERGGRQ